MKIRETVNVMAALNVKSLLDDEMTVVQKMLLFLELKNIGFSSTGVRIL